MYKILADNEQTFSDATTVTGCIVEPSNVSDEMQSMQSITEPQETSQFYPEQNFTYNSGK